MQKTAQTAIADIVPVHVDITSTTTGADASVATRPAQLARSSASGFVIVFALQGDIAVHLRNFTKIPVSANALQSNSVQAHNVSIPTPASVSVPAHDQNALLHKCSMTGPASASVQK